MGVFDQTKTDFLSQFTFSTSVVNRWWHASGQVSYTIPYMYKNIDVMTLGQFDHNVIITDIYAQASSFTIGTQSLITGIPNNVDLDNVVGQSIDNIKKDTIVDGNTNNVETFVLDEFQTLSEYNNSEYFISFPIPMVIKIGNINININVGNTMTHNEIYTENIHEILDNSNPITYKGLITLNQNDLTKYNIKDIQITIKYLYKEDEGNF